MAAMKMPVKLSLTLLSSIILSGCTLPLLGNSKAGLQITSSPQANVSIDGQSIGLTPIIRDNLKTGSKMIKIAASDSTVLPWEGQVALNPGAVTILDRQLSSDPTQASGYSLTFEKLSDKNASEVSITTTQENISVAIDGNPSGFTPLKTNSISAGAHIFLLNSPGYQDKTIKATVQIGYRLVINAQLAAAQITPTPTPTLSPTATPSGSLTPTPTRKTDLSPTPKSTTSATLAKPYVEILSSPTGWLRVRETGSASGTELAKVNPGERFPYISSNDTGWHQIEYTKGQKGWVSGTYSKVVK